MGKLIDPKECPKCMPEWLAAFGDLMSLLLCFFVLLLSMSTMDAKKFETAVGSLAGALSILDGGARPEVQNEKETESQSKVKIEKVGQQSRIQITKAVQAINELLSASGSPEVSVEESEDGFVIRLPAQLLFAKGQAQISGDDAKLFLKRISLVIKQLPLGMVADIVGHTDSDDPDITSPFRDNWQLSTARAIAVVEQLIKDGVDPKMLIASGRASFDPYTSNATPLGMEKNNRVEIRFLSFDMDKRNTVQKSILDSIQQ